MAESTEKKITVLDGAWKTKTEITAHKTANGNWTFRHGVGYDNAPHVVKEFKKGEHVIRSMSLMGFPGRSSRHAWAPCGIVINSSTVLVNPQKGKSEFGKEYYFEK